jgi:hypothetical protein
LRRRGGVAQQDELVYAIVQQSNFLEHAPLRISDMSKVEVHIVESKPGVREAAAELGAGHAEVFAQEIVHRQIVAHLARAVDATIDGDGEAGP